jgi:uncharacterized protein (TIGR02117 family)
MVALLVSACAAKIERRIPADAADTRRIFIVHDQWHAAIVAQRTDIAPDEIPELAYFGDAEYVEFSWGDADFFPAPEGSIGLALRAAFWSRGSVLHLVGFKGAVKATSPSAEIIELSLSAKEFQKLIAFISAEFKRDEPSLAATPSPGLSSQSRFFPANSKFSLLRTCNAWVAEALGAAGLPVRSTYVFTAGNLANQVRPLGSVKWRGTEAYHRDDTEPAVSSKKNWTSGRSPSKQTLRGGGTWLCIMECCAVA